MLCDKCHEREATVHATTVVGEKATTENLCAQCSESDGTDVASLLEAGCHYCDGEFYCTAPDLFAQSSSKAWALCRSCATEFYSLRNGLPVLERDLHMKRWVTERDSR
jgi:protein-arginine kinase activator protein McsA